MPNRKPQAEIEELEFVFSCFQRGLTIPEIQDEVQDTAFLPRDYRTYRYALRNFQAAKNVLGEQIQATAHSASREEDEDRKELLVSGLQLLRRPQLPLDLPNCWDWSTGEPRMKSVEDMMSDLARPDNAEVKYLLDYLEPGDPILVGHLDSGEVLRTLRKLCGRLYGELVDRTERVAQETDVPMLNRRKSPCMSPPEWFVESRYVTTKVEKRLNIPTLSRWTTPSVWLTEWFIETLYQMAGHLVSNYLEGNRGDYPLIRYPIDIQLSQLLFGSKPIASGSCSQFHIVEAAFKKVEAAHRMLLSELRQYRLVHQIALVRHCYDKVASELNKAIDLKSSTMEFSTRNGRNL